ncbi:MAG: GerMN domain-containing protein, partial [Clostridia bacterium]|nr:GerMN domain-containing protein [Clostridia bacterium]
MRKRLLPLLLGVSFLLTACTTSIPVESDLTNVPDPGVRDAPPAPVGDSQSGREVSIELFVPDPNTLKLTVRVETAYIHSGQSKQEAVVEALLRAINESSFHNHLRQPLRLAQVSNAVETSGELVTVNLHTSARLLREEALFALRVALTNTLTALPDIHYVNVLIDGKDIGLDFEGTLPTGVLSSYPSGDVTTLWGQMNVQRDAGWNTELQKTATLYYVSEDGKSLISLVRNITFPERDMAEYAKCLLEEMTIVASMEGLRIVVPPSEYYERDPIYERPGGSANGYIHIYLHSAIDDQLATRGSTRAMLA